MRALSRGSDSLRKIELLPNVSKFADGSCLASFGDTKVLCAATIDEKVPAFLRKSGTGWITAEYGMLPRSTETRMERESVRGQQSGRTQEIQRLIGRSLRSVADLAVIGERQIIVDCDVLQADGGTRTASITGGFVALHMALAKLKYRLRLDAVPLSGMVAAVSCGIVGGAPMLDLDFAEDSAAGTDANFVMTDRGRMVEVQGTAEGAPFSEEEFANLLALAKKGIAELFALQRKVLNIKEA